jgi:perosamine synthetase
MIATVQHIYPNGRRNHAKLTQNTALKRRQQLNKLALLGGSPVRTKLYPAYNTIGEEEKRAVREVLDSGNLSQFLGAWHADFLGGPKVRKFEDAWSEFVGSKFTISVNSNTSGLIAAMGAASVGPGDEVIVSPYSMSASAVAPLMYGAVPVFADIDPDTFCISPSSFQKAITPRTKALLVVHIFGQTAEMDEIMSIARRHKIVVVEDCAQAPFATYKGRSAGVLGDMGVFSLNYHKHIHTGEGGMVTTNDPELAKRLQLIRNHGENAAEQIGVKDIFQTHGYNFRLPEMEAAIGIEQLKKVSALVSERIELADRFTQKLRTYEGITPPLVKPGNRHSYYVHANKWDARFHGFHRNTFVKAMQAELPSAELRETTPLIGAGYVRPLYLAPIYQKRATRCAFSCPRYEGTANYEKGLCPTAEEMHFEKVFTHEFIRPVGSKNVFNDFFNAVDKILENKDSLIAWEKKNE